MIRTEPRIPGEATQMETVHYDTLPKQSIFDSHAQFQIYIVRLLSTERQLSIFRDFMRPSEVE